jgi:hypothetical protein
MSESRPPNRKRRASEADMGDHDEESMTERLKSTTTLETRLTELRNVLTLDFAPEWKEHDPGYFIAGMDRLRNLFFHLDSTTIEEYIEENGHEREFLSLDLQEFALQKTNLNDLPSPTKRARESMLEFVDQVRRRLKGRSSQHVPSYCFMC